MLRGLRLQLQGFQVGSRVERLPDVDRNIVFQQGRLRLLGQRVISNCILAHGRGELCSCLLHAAVSLHHSHLCLRHQHLRKLNVERRAELALR